MKGFLISFGLLLAICGSSYAQMAESRLCPYINVYAPTTVVEPGGLAEFILKVDTKGKRLNLEYVWSANDAYIVSGQGTTRIKVQMPDVEQALVATAVIRGIPAGCPNAATEQYKIGAAHFVNTTSERYKATASRAMSLGEISRSPFRLNMAILNTIDRSFRENANTRVFLVLRFEPDQLKSVTRTIKQQLINMDLDSSRVTFKPVTAVDSDISVWLVPPGAARPTP